MTKNFVHLLILFFLLPLFARAFSAELIVDTGTETINAIEATIQVPQGVNIDKIYSGNSAILFWVVPPIYDEGASSISFSGITPGGFKGDKMVLLSFSGEFSIEYLASATFSEVNALRNDGLGTSIPVKLSIQPTEIATDEIPPEPFNLTISSSPEVFSGLSFLSFATQDKGTGVDHYEIATTWFLFPDERDWSRVESPMVLSRILRFKTVYVRAIDSMGNYRTSSIVGAYHYATMFLGTIILLCILLFATRFWRSRF